MDNTCISCGVMIPEGRWLCPTCENSCARADAILADGTPLYFKTTAKPTPTHGSLQLFLYDLLTKGEKS